MMMGGTPNQIRRTFQFLQELPKQFHLLLELQFKVFTVMTRMEMGNMIHVTIWTLQSWLHHRILLPQPVSTRGWR